MLARVLIAALSLTSRLDVSLGSVGKAGQMRPCYKHEKRHPGTTECRQGTKADRESRTLPGGMALRPLTGR
ncbi:hypothetical protein [Acidithrix ferrooxidans]|uniref:hypothetical protein n=1 Tax=Acidithrix ferrooxidans TaxID=1280514 RepID=UPI00126A30A4|nr:hypothetical protein [Acidithrix ferrooxidans]